MNKFRLLFLFVSGLMMASAAYAQTLRISGPLTGTSGSTLNYTVTFSTLKDMSRFEIGAIATPAGTVVSTSAAPALGKLNGRSPFNEKSFSLEGLDRGQSVEFTFSVTTQSTVGGTMSVRAFIRSRQDFAPGAQTVNTALTVPATLPVPSLIAPRANALVSASPFMRVQSNSTPAQLVFYEIEVTPPSGSVRLFTTGSANTGTPADIMVPYLSGFRTGVYTWRARARNAAGAFSDWSASRTFTASGGMDMAGSATQTQLNAFKAGGWDSFFQAAWGGRNRWSSARQNLINANAAGMAVAAYCFLNFDNGSTIAGAPANQTGAWQVDQALQACGYTGSKASLGFDLKYMMVDIENTFAGTMTPDNRVQRVAEACQRARNLGFWTMIYTRNENSNTWWNTMTGSSTDFSDLPLWNSLPETETNLFRDDITTFRSASVPFFGGWTANQGKQWLLDITVNGVGVDFNTWVPSIWQVTSPNPGSPTIPQPTQTLARLTSSSRYEVAFTVRNTGTCEAYATRIMSMTLGGVAPDAAKISLQTVPAGGSRLGRATFPFTAGAAGSVVPLTYTVWTGLGPQTYTVNVTLP